MGISIGFDPSLRHGTMVQCKFERNALEDVTILAEWNARNSSGIDYKSSITSSFHFCNDLLKQLPPSYLYAHVPPIAIDWDPQSVYWRAVKLQVVQMAAVLGYLSRGFLERGYPLVFISPREVRNFLGLPLKNCEKSEVHEVFLQRVSKVESYARGFSSKVRVDILDSIILAYIVDISTEVKKEIYGYKSL